MVISVDAPQTSTDYVATTTTATMATATTIETTTMAATYHTHSWQS